MLKFPIKKTRNSKNYAEEYLNTLSEVSKKIDFNTIEKLSKLISRHYLSNKNIFVCGNGGSASVSNHFICDHLKRNKFKHKFITKNFSLSSSLEIIILLLQMI